MSVVCTIKSPWRETGWGRVLFEREFTMKKNLLLNNQQDANEVRVRREEWIFFLGS